MQWQGLGLQDCPIARSMAVLGDRWTLLVLRDCFFGVSRFDGFVSSLGISRTMVRDRLRGLIEAGVLERRAYQTAPVRHDYRLTAKGRALEGVMMLLAAWANEHTMSEAEGPLVVQVHKTCGHAMIPRLDCSECGEPILPGSVRTYPARGRQVPSSSSTLAPPSLASTT
jgi:DNA-binding HxlR family transcriptional regulator